WLPWRSESQSRTGPEGDTRDLSDQLLPQHDDHFLLQFLRARRFDMKRTEDMLRRHFEFRKEFPEEYMVNEYKPPQILLDHLLPPLIGYDKEGCPVRIIHVGHQDIKGKKYRILNMRFPLSVVITYNIDEMNFEH
ncbi:SEC14-like protein 2, partial [Trichonephila clavata]